MFLYFEILKKNPVFAYTEEALISIGIHEEQYTGMFKEKDIRKFNDMQFLYEKYELWQSKNCRDYMLLQILKFKQGWKTAKTAGFPSVLISSREFNGSGKIPYRDIGMGRCIKQDCENDVSAV